MRRCDLAGAPLYLPPVPRVPQAYRTQLNLFLAEVKSQTTLPLLKQHLLLYSSIDIAVRVKGVCFCAAGRGCGTQLPGAPALSHSCLRPAVLPPATNQPLPRELPARPPAVVRTALPAALL